MLKGAPALLQEREATFAETTKTSQKGVSGTGIHIQLASAGGLLDRHVYAEASTFVARVGQQRHLFQLFQSPVTNPRGAQLVFASHDAALLGRVQGQDVLRRDQIWFVEKSEDGSSLAEKALKSVVPGWSKGGTRYADFKAGVADACRRARALDPEAEGQLRNPSTAVWKLVQAIGLAGGGTSAG